MKTLPEKQSNGEADRDWANTTVMQKQFPTDQLKEIKHWHWAGGKKKMCAKQEALGSIPGCATHIFPFLQPSGSRHVRGGRTTRPQRDTFLKT